MDRAQGEGRARGIYILACNTDTENEFSGSLPPSKRTPQCFAQLPTRPTSFPVIYFLHVTTARSSKRHVKTRVRSSFLGPFLVPNLVPFSILEALSLSPPPSHHPKGGTRGPRPTTTCRINQSINNQPTQRGTSRLYA